MKIIQLGKKDMYNSVYNICGKKIFFSLWVSQVWYSFVSEMVEVFQVEELRG